jgi:uncharacterized FAD-dependent dehydrogenase
MRVELEVRVNLESSLEEELKKLGIEGDYQIVRKSLDARKKPYFLYRVLVDLPEKTAKKFIEEGKAKEHVPVPKVQIPLVSQKKRVLVVGAGPAGLFSALVLARGGLEVTLVERGKPIEERVKDVTTFWKKRKLNENSNVQFGEGGAGTFSDGKLTTRVKDKKKHFVYSVLVECGAPPEILYENKPHIGTDKLREVIVAFREKLKSLGVEFRFSTLLKDIKLEGGKVVGVTLKDFSPGLRL